jgi:hypothetical protein
MQVVARAEGANRSERFVLEPLPPSEVGLAAGELVQIAPHDRRQ